MSAAPPPEPTRVRNPGCILPLVATVGFAGHRKLDGPEAVGESIALAFEAIANGVGEMAKRKLGQGPETVASAYGGPTTLRLLTGDASGADRLAIAAWRARGLGEVHALYPYRDPVTGGALTDQPDRAAPVDRIADPPPFGRWTGLDSLGLGLKGDAGHSEQARWILRHSDVLVAVWNGAAPAGAGGTGETVLRALERGLLVVWIKPGRDRPRLLDPYRLPRHVSAAMVVEEPDAYAQDLAPPALGEALAATFMPPGDYDPKTEPGEHPRRDPEIVAREDYCTVDPLTHSDLDRLLDRTAWRAFAVFKRTAGDLKNWEGPIPQAEFIPSPADLQRQPGFCDLAAAFSEADERANQLGAIHRSQQLTLSTIAVFAVLIGSLPFLATIDTHSPRALEASEARAHLAHVLAAIGELVLAVLSFILSTNAARAHRHRRWSDARRLAERLRAACATWPLGVDMVDISLGRPQSWTEWRARAELRAAGPPLGWFGRQELDARGAWAASQLIASQVSYHAKERHAAQHIAERLDALKESAFAVLVVCLALFVASSLLAWAFHFELPAWVSGWVSVVGAVSPAVAAAALALESTNGFEELAIRSSRLREKFEELGRELAAAGPQPHVHHVQDVLRGAAQLLVEDADSWRDRAVRRKIATTA